MAILPTNQDITQFMGSNIGKPTDFNPAQQNSMGAGGVPMQQPHPQQPMNMAPSPYMPASGPYNPYLSQWSKLMGGPNAQGGVGQAPTSPMPQMPQGGMPMGQVMRPQMPQMPQGGMQANPMMSGIFRSPMVR